MAPRPAEIAVVYLSGLAQGVALVTFPALGGVLTSPRLYGLSASRYGALFLPLVVLAIIASSLSPRLASRVGMKWVLVGGLCANVVSMGVLVLSQRVTGRPDAAYGALLVATAALGAGFGATLTALNTYVQTLFPTRTEAALPALHAFLGTGTTLAPVLAAVFMRGTAWWLLPSGVALALLGLVAASLTQRLRAASDARGPASIRAAFPPRFARRLWVYAGAVALYGTCETLFGNWATIYLHGDAGVSAYWADVALAAFWAMVTAGRIGAAAVSAWVPETGIYRALPVLVLAAFVAIPRVGGATAGVVAFGFAGLACSAFFPLSISFAEDELSGWAATASGTLVAVYMVGYGIGAYGVGAARDAGHLTLSAIYTAAAVLAAGMAVLAVLVTRSSGASR
ncbi:MAG TPA: MFS transporter [bacterium]|nr:MFS transporter [bacterium]